MQLEFNIAYSVYQNSISHPDHLAVAASEKTLSYGQIANQANNLAACLRQSSAWSKQPDGQPARVAILASKSLHACLGVVGVAWSGASYVPISLKLPEARLIAMLTHGNFAALITDQEGAQQLTAKVLAHCPPLIILPDTQRFQHRLPHHRVIHDIDALPDAEKFAPTPVAASDTAYIIFTSGSTGAPKGVSISAQSLCHFTQMLSEQLGFQATDRVLETCELCFDFSVHNMFTCWQAGASLHILPTVQTMNAVKFCRDHALTVWNAVPSLAGRLIKINALKPNALPSLRISIFGGEPLPKSFAEQWQAAAPNSTIENLYGPTEATVFCLRQSVTPDTPTSLGSEFIAIGKPLPGTCAVILDQTGARAAPGTAGELALSGVQLSSGYLDAPELTRRHYVTIQGTRHYLTGDLAMQDAAGVFHYLGRIDNQVKIRGHRVELEEVDAHLRKASAASLVATVAWPLIDGNAQGLVSFVEAQSVDQQAILATLRAYLPAYMMPDRIVAIDSMPLNQSGKSDRKALLQSLMEPVA